jgi:hypothetical protein
MTTSGVSTFEITQSDLITDAMMASGALANAETCPGDEYAAVLRTLNMMVKAWSAGANPTARGLKMWARKSGTLILQKNQASYSLGPTGDHASASVVKTTLTANSPTSDTTLTVASITGISNGDIIGVILDSGSVHWTTVNGAPGSSIVTITTGLTSAAASGNRVFAYTTILQRPLEIISMLIRDEDGNDQALGEMLLGDYESLGRKDQDGTPSRFYFENQLTDAKIYFDFEPSDVSQTIEFVYRRPLDDMVSTGDSPDFPQEWYEALKYNLAVRIATEYSLAVSQDLMTLAQLSLAEANSFYPETSNLYFEPDRPY